MLLVVKGHHGISCEVGPRKGKRNLFLSGDLVRFKQDVLRAGNTTAEPGPYHCEKNRKKTFPVPNYGSIWLCCCKHTRWLIGAAGYVKVFPGV